MSNGADEVRVSYLTMTAPALWGSVGSVVTDPGEGRYLIVRRLVPDRGPEGYLIVDLVDAEIYRGFATEKAARAEVVRLCAHLAAAP